MWSRPNHHGRAGVIVRMQTFMRVSALLAAGALALAGCGRSVSLDPSATEPAAPSPSEEVALVRHCEDVTPLGAPSPPSPDGNEPRPSESEVLASEAAASAVAEEQQSWARQFSEHFAGMWLDRAAGPVLTVAFTDELERYRSEVADRFGPDVRVLEAAHSLAELQAASDAVAADLASDPPAIQVAEGGRVYGTGVDVMRNRAAVDVLGGGDDVRRQLAERYPAELLCVRLQPIPGPDQAEVAPWAPAPDAALSSQTTQLPVLVNEVACASGQDASGRIPEPEIVYQQDAVVVTIRVIPLGGAQSCPSNPDTPYTLVLDEPLGERRLLDGGVDPPTPPDLER